MADEDGYAGPRRHDEAGLGRLLNIIKEQERRIAALERGAPLRAAGISASPDGLTVGSSLDVTGDLSATGNTEIGGNASITGTLSLPAGIIDNDALASPVAFDSNYGNAYDFALGTTDAAEVEFTLTVPPGFTKVLLTSSANLQVVKSTGDLEYIRNRIYVLHDGGVWQSRLISVPVDPNGGSQAASSVAVGVTFPCVPGQQITVRQVVSASAPIPAMENTGAYTYAAAIYGR